MVAGRLVVGMTTFSVGVACQVRERTGVRGSLLSMARFSLSQETKIENGFLISELVLTIYLSSQRQLSYTVKLTSGQHTSFPLPPTE